MPLTFMTGDPLQTDAQVLAFGYNARGKHEVDPLHTTLQYRYPAAFAVFGKQARGGRISAGQLWIWRESAPYLGFMVVRESSVGATRVRYVQAAALTLARDYALEGIRSVAIAGLCSAAEFPSVAEVLRSWLAGSKLDVRVYSGD
jgi:hypothetical protein